MKKWLVAGGLLESTDGLLLVQNRRRNGSLDWSTPGGVIDAGETILEGLSREVVEETGLAVETWDGLAYEVEVDFVDRDMTLRVEAHVARTWSGTLRVDDPDGIVVDADFVDHVRAAALVDAGPRWVGEPLLCFLAERLCGVVYRYDVEGIGTDQMSVRRRIT